jgi:hypothetical protein
MMAGTVLAPTTWCDAAEFLSVVRGTASKLMLDRTAGQKTRLIVLCEAAGMAPQLERVTREYCIPVSSGGGFDSVTDKYKFAAELVDHDRPTEVLHVGDHDPSGAHLFLAAAEDIAAFAHELGGEVSFTRLAVTPHQIRQYRLPTAPAKETDRRAFHGGTCQAEALAPDVLAGILRQALEQRIDQRTLGRVLKREGSVRRELTQLLL